MTVKCETCPFFKASEEGSEGECHYWPPMPDPVGGSAFPVVRNDDYCAQHPSFQV